jgi:hypothetical protein
MNPFYLPIAVFVVAAALLRAWVTVRRCRSRLTGAQAQHERERNAIAAKLEQAKKQIGQLQTDLAAARRDVKRLQRERGAPAVNVTVGERAPLMIDKPPVQGAAANGGFADTLPSKQFVEEALALR